VKFNISNVEFHLNFQKKLSDKICIELNIANVEFQNRDTVFNSFKTGTLG